MTLIPENPIERAAFGYPFGLATLCGAVIGAAVTLLAACLRGPRAAVWPFAAGVALAAVYSAATCGPFLISRSSGWEGLFNDLYVPTASVFGQLLGVWIVIAGFCGGIGFALRRVTRSRGMGSTPS
jgi:hypothetical protein